MTASHVNSWYAASLDGELAFPTLNQELTVDVCVIGAGLAGLTTARELANAGKSVALLEGKRIAWAASGRNGGFVLPGYALGQSSIERKVGKLQADQLYGLSVEGADYVRDTISSLQRDDIIQGHGYLSLLRHSDDRAFREEAEKDPDVAFLDRAAIQELARSDRYKAGLLEPTGFHIHPLRYAQALAGSAASSGAQIFEKSFVSQLQKPGAKWICRTSKGSVHADQVVLTTSAYGGPHNRLERSVLPVATYVITSEHLGECLDDAIRFGGCLSDTRRAGDYYRITSQGDDRRLLWGGRITTRRSEPMKLAEMLKQDILDIYPQLRDFKVDYAWSGLMGYATHKMPLIGEMEPGLWVGTAFGGHGLNTTAMAGKVISRAITQGDEDWKMFQPYDFNWNGGVVGQVATQLEYWRLQALDWWEER